MYPGCIGGRSVVGRAEPASTEPGFVPWLYLEPVGIGAPRTRGFNGARVCTLVVSQRPITKAAPYSSFNGARVCTLVVSGQSSTHSLRRCGFNGARVCTLVVSSKSRRGGPLPAGFNGARVCTLVVSHERHRRDMGFSASTEPGFVPWLYPGSASSTVSLVELQRSQGLYPGCIQQRRNRYCTQNSFNGARVCTLVVSLLG